MLTEEKARVIFDMYPQLNIGHLSILLFVANTPSCTLRDLMDNLDIPTKLLAIFLRVMIVDKDPVCGSYFGFGLILSEHRVPKEHTKLTLSASGKRLLALK